MKKKILSLRALALGYIFRDPIQQDYKYLFIMPINSMWCLFIEYKRKSDSIFKF